MNKLPTGRLPTINEWNSWAAQFLRRSGVTGKNWSLADIFRNSAETRQCFVRLCDDGCDAQWLAQELVRFARWSSTNTGTKPFAPGARRVRMLNRLTRDLKRMLTWEPFPMLIEPGSQETMFFKIRDFESSLQSALKLLPSNYMANFTVTNAQALAASSIIGGIKAQTKAAHFREAVILLDAVLKAEGRTDLFNNEEKLKKVVKRNSAKKFPSSGH